MIYTVTLNPALDRFILVEQLLADIDAQLLRLESGETDETNEQEPSPACTDAHNPTESL